MVMPPSIARAADSAPRATDDSNLEGESSPAGDDEDIVPDQGRTSVSDQAALGKAVALYDSGQYQSCAEALTRLLDSSKPRRLASASSIETAHVYLGACLIGAGQAAKAEDVFREAIRQNPQMKAPDSLVFPEAVVERFLRVREGMLAEIRRAEKQRMKQAEERARNDERQRWLEREHQLALMRLASTEIVIERHSRWVAALPFGVGQFQNGNRGLGWTLFGAQSLLMATMIGAIYADAWYDSKSNDPGVDTGQLRQRREDARLVWAIASFGWLGVATAGIVEAEIAFVPEIRTQRHRELPRELREPAPEQAPKTSQLKVQLVPSLSPKLLGLDLTATF